ncbi:MAG: M28 family peptidase, partial [Oscillospiraceae bacterium]|nr:M28 family peptidase [Oscillospiraceae bacterium]
MDATFVNRVLADTAYVHTGGSAEELKCAEYLKQTLAEMGLAAELEAFEVDMADMQLDTLTVDGEEIPCKGYLCAGDAEVEAPLYYLTGDDKGSLAACRGKIVLLDGYLGFWRYSDILENGAVGFITYDGNANYADEDIDRRELRGPLREKGVIPGVNINAKKAIELVKKGAKTAKITLRQKQYTANSHNVVLDMPGEREEYIVLTAHYDTTSLSEGAYDNMSGSIGLLAIAEHFKTQPHSYGLRFVWCGSEERGLLGSKAYAAAHEEELSKFALCINLDMIGCIMGKFIACCTTEQKLVHYIQYMGSCMGFGVSAFQDVYSSDSTPFADKGVPAL